MHGQGDSAKTSENRDIHPIHLNTPKNYEVEEDIEYLFEERAAIYQFDAGYSKSEVERLARIDVMDELESAS